MEQPPSLVSFDTSISIGGKKRPTCLKFTALMILITFFFHDQPHVIKHYLQANGNRVLTLSTIHRPIIHSLLSKNEMMLNYELANSPLF